MKNVSSWKQMDANSCCLTGHRGCSKWKSTPLQLSSDTAKSSGFYHGSQLLEEEEKKKKPLSLPNNFPSHERLNVWALHFHQALAAEAVIGAPPGLQKLQLRYFDLHPFKNGQTNPPPPAGGLICGRCKVIISSRESCRIPDIWPQGGGSALVPPTPPSTHSFPLLIFS